MTIHKTASERVDNLISLSDRIYEVIDIDGRAQRMLTLGIQVVAQTLKVSHGFRVGGDTAHRLLIAGLHEGGLSIHDAVYDQFPAYRKTAAGFNPVAISGSDQQLAEFALRYGTVERATFDRNAQPETNARHAIHLSALALPYATEYYPHLDQSLIALYSLVHDAVEGYVGDTKTLNITDSGIREKQHREQRGLAMMKSEFGSVHPRFVEIVERYEELSDDEAKFVKTMDKNDPHYVHLYTDGEILLDEFGDAGEQKFRFAMDKELARILKYGIEFGTVLDDRAEFIDRSASNTWSVTT